MNEYLNQPLDEYLADKRLSNSGVELWRDDRATFAARMFGAEPWPDPTDEMKLGLYFEDLLFNPSVVKTNYVVAPERPDDPGKVIHRGSKEYKDFARGVAGRTIVLPDQAALACEMIEAVDRHPVATKLVRRGRGVDQIVLRWKCPITGVEKKGRPDRMLLLPNQPWDVVLDLKTDRDPRNTMERRRRWHDRGYHRKLAWYQEGWQVITGRNAIGFIVAVSNTRPVRCCVYKYEPDCTAIKTGHVENLQNVREIAEAMSSGFWGYPEELEAVEGAVPPWAAVEAASAGEEPSYDQAS